MRVRRQRAWAGGRQYARALAMARWVAFVALLLVAVSARKNPPRSEPQIEEVTAKQLERVLEDKDYVAVFWCKCWRAANATRRSHHSRSSPAAPRPIF